MIGNDDLAMPILLEELLRHRRGRRVQEADQVKRILLSEHSIRVYYRRDGTFGWSKVDREASDIEGASGIVWSMATVGGRGLDEYRDA